MPPSVVSTKYTYTAVPVAHTIRGDEFDLEDRKLQGEIETAIPKLVSSLRQFLARNILVFTSLNIILLAFSLPILVVYSVYGTPYPGSAALKATTFYSPLLNTIDVPQVIKRLNATLVEVDHPGNIFRQPPSPEVDEAWRVISDTRPIRMTRADVVALGKDPDTAVKFDASLGYGPDVYAGRLDVFHQIHCLDALRREAYFDYYYGAKYPGGYNTTSEMHKLHFTHCISYLLENIMCSASLDVYTHMWTDTLSHPFPDFAEQRKCMSFDTVLDWQKQNAVAIGPFVQMERPEDAPPALEMVRKFKEIHGYYDTHEDDGRPGEVVA